MFAWYWLADLCQDQSIPFVLGHALYMKAIHGGKTKNDKIDADKIAALLRGGNLPQAYVYPRGMRETRDLLRRRCFLVRQRAQLIAHIQNNNSQYNLPALRQEAHLRRQPRGTRRRRPLPASLRATQRRDRSRPDRRLRRPDRRAGTLPPRHAKVDDGDTYHRLLSIPGVGKILALMLLYEIHDIGRFPEVGNFLSYARLVRCAHESAGKKKGSAARRSATPT